MAPRSIARDDAVRPEPPRVVTPSGSRLRDALARRHFPALDGLRAIAVFVVIMGHADYPIQHVPADLGVSVFFVLSGFLITRLLLREQRDTGSVSLSRFYARRTLRIFPAYYVFIAVSFVLDATHGQRGSRALSASALTYTVNYFNAFHHHPDTSIAHAWSLGVEEQFYLLWPAAFLLMARRGARTIVRGTVVAAVCVIAWRAWLLYRGVDVAYLYNAFDTRFDNLAIGCLLAVIADRSAFAHVADLLARRPWYPLVTLAVLLGSRLVDARAYHYSIGFTVDAVLVAVFITQLLQLYTSKLWSWIEHPVARYLGTISYPIYLYHQWGASVGRHLPGTGRPREFVGGVLATIVIASTSYYVIERPFLSLKHRFERGGKDSQGIRAAPAQAAPVAHPETSV